MWYRLDDGHDDRCQFPGGCEQPVAWMHRPSSDSERVMYCVDHGRFMQERISHADDRPHEKCAWCNQADPVNDYYDIDNEPVCRRCRWNLYADRLTGMHAGQLISTWPVSCQPAAQWVATYCGWGVLPRGKFLYNLIDEDRWDTFVDALVDEFGYFPTGISRQSTTTELVQEVALLC